MHLEEFVYDPIKRVKKKSSVNEQNDSSDEEPDLQSKRPRDHDTEERNSRLVVAIGFTAFFIAFVVMVLSWVLYGRHNNGTFLALGIVMIFIWIFIGFCIYWGLKTLKNIKKRRVPSTILSSMVFFVSMFLTGYCVVCCMMLIFYKPIHYDYLIGLFTHKEKWNTNMPTSNFDEGWSQNKAIIIAITILLLVLAGCFLFFSYAASSVSYKRFNKIRDSLYFALILITISSWGGLYWSRESFEKLDFINNKDAEYQVNFMKILTIVALVFAFLNALVNLAKIKWTYFIMSFLAIILLCMIVVCSAATWREVRLEQFRERADTGSQSCITTMYTIHETRINTWCNVNGGKYLNQPITCGKAFLATRWEGAQLGEIRSLNPACCLSAKHYYIWPYMMMAFFGTILMIATAMASMFNLYLSDSTFFMGSFKKRITTNDYLGLGILIGFNLLLGLIFFIARIQDPAIHSRAAYYNSFLMPESHLISGWQTVPEKLLNQTNPPRTTSSSIGSVCFSYDMNILPASNFDRTSRMCSEPEGCVIRFAAALLDNAKFFLNNDNSSITSLQQNKYVFFPNCAQNISDYIMFTGTQSEVKKVLDSIKICPKSTVDMPRIMIYKDQVPITSLGLDGLTPSESVSDNESNQDYSLCGRAFSDVSCQALPCKLTKPLDSQLVYRTLKGRLYYVNNGQITFSLPNTVRITASDSAGEIPASVKIYQNGLFSIEKVALYRDVPYILRLKFVDMSQEFLTSEVDIVIGSKYGDEPSAQIIRLNTADGVICPPGSKVDCIREKRTKFGSITVIVNDGSSLASSSNNKRLSGVRLIILQGMVYQGKELYQAVTDLKGVALFNNVPYGSYAIVAIKEGYKPSIQFISLQETNLNPSPFSLNPAVADFDIKVIAEMIITSSDYDLILQMKNANGDECEVSPYSKYCPYSFHASDISTGPGEESIILKKLSVATYNAFVQQSPPYDPKCSSNEFMKANAYHYGAASIDWRHVQSTTDIPIYRGMIKPRLASGTLSNELTLVEQLMSSVQPTQLIESLAQSRVEKIVVSSDGVPLPVSQQYKQDTNFIEKDRRLDNNKTDIIRKNTTKYNFLLCSNPPIGASSCLNGTSFISDNTKVKKLALVDYYTDSSESKNHIEVYRDRTDFRNGTKQDTCLELTQSTFVEVNKQMKISKFLLNESNPDSSIKQNSTSQYDTTYSNRSREMTSSMTFNLTRPNNLIQTLVEHSKSMIDDNKESNDYRLVNTTSKVGLVDIVSVTSKSMNKTATLISNDGRVDEKLAYHNGSKGEIFKIVYERDYKYFNNTTNLDYYSVIEHQTGYVKKREVRMGNYKETKNPAMFNYFNYSEVNATEYEEYKLDQNPSPGLPDKEWQNNTSRNYTISYSSDAGVELTSCNVFNETSREKLTNDSTTIERVNVNKTCGYKNGSSVLVYNRSYIQVSNISGTLAFANNTNLTIDVTYANGTDERFYLRQNTGTRDPTQRPTRILVTNRDVNSHLQDGAGISPVVNVGGKYIWVSCFTGFGDASVIFINSIQNEKPDLTSCENKIKTERPKYTVEKLKEAVSTFDG